MKIKEFLSKYESAIDAVNDDYLESLETVFKSLSIEFRPEIARVNFKSHEKSVITSYHNLTLDLVNKIELVLIQKVGSEAYLFELIRVTQKTPIDMHDFYWHITPEDLLAVATADARTKLAAILLALSEVE